MDKYINFFRAEHNGIDHRRKYSNQLYFDAHCVPVAELFAKVMETLKAPSDFIQFGFKIAVGHDFIEDVEPVTKKSIQKYLVELSGEKDYLEVLGGIIQLTDYYTPENFPDLNRKKRKNFEAVRLSEASYVCRMVKFCDLIHNTSSIKKSDLKFFESCYKDEILLLAKSIHERGNYISDYLFRRLLDKIDE